MVSATIASSGEIDEHHHGHADEQQHRRQHLAQRLLQALGQVVEVVGDPAEQVAARLLVDVAQGEGVDLGLGLGPQPLHEPLHDAGDHPRRARPTARPSAT